ncbi:MAG TPA: proton-conducting transporter membrane subunit [Thiobacillaceae bacterium]|nr:proton-conducting transporter membrane subunit [Thiobacillaceae bacterium]
MTAWLDPLAWLVVLPLAWAALAFLMGPGRGGRLAVVALAAQLVLALALAGQVLEEGPRTHLVGGWGAPLGIDLLADGLAVAMLLLTQAVALPLAVYARAYFSEVNQAHFWPLAGFLLAALNALFLSADLFNLYVTLELLSLAAVGLVALGGKPAQVAAALRYLLVSLTASGAYLMGVALIYAAYGTVSIATLAPLTSGEAPLILWLAAGLMLAGLMAKTALFPFHFWLPPAHGGAPAPVSALLSALVVKASFYLVLRLALDVFPSLAASAAPILGVLGAAAILWGSWRALRTQHIKMLVAWSTVAQLGYLFLVFPLLAPDGLAQQAGVMQAIAHGLAKAAMFAAAGVLMLATGRDTLEGLAGVAGRVPVTLFAFGLAGVTLMGLPPSGGFLAKWLLIEAALSHGQWPWVVVVIGGGLLAAAYVFRVLRQAFLLAPEDSRFHPVPQAMEWTAFVLAAASVLLGLRGVELMNLLAMAQAT